MLLTSLADNIVFHADKPYSEPLYVDKHGRILRFMLKPGQKIIEHKSPTSPVYIVILQGEGIFTDGEGTPHSVKPDDLLVFDVGEKHSVQAGDNEFIFLAILRGVPDIRPDHIGGTLVKDEETRE